MEKQQQKKLYVLLNTDMVMASAWWQPAMLRSSLVLLPLEALKVQRKIIWTQVAGVVGEKKRTNKSQRQSAGCSAHVCLKTVANRFECYVLLLYF